MLPPIRLGVNQRENLVKLVRELTAFQPEFLVHLKNYNRFGERTLYVGVELNSELNQLHEKLLFLSKEWGFEKGQTQAFHPHLTLINRDIIPENFQLAWNKFKDRKFETKFVADSLFLLELKGPLWEIVEEFSFNRKPSQT